MQPARPNMESMMATPHKEKSHQFALPYGIGFLLDENVE